MYRRRWKASLNPKAHLETTSSHFRQTYVEFRDHQAIAKQRVPQGNWISPILFNIYYMQKLPHIILMIAQYSPFAQTSNKVIPGNSTPTFNERSLVFCSDGSKMSMELGREESMGLNLKLELITSLYTSITVFQTEIQEIEVWCQKKL